ncbi:MAG TPA: sulfotransferase [Solirubrobacterales bacterium]|nr:sulfotransferase [Solirubrobacterales bacterium]
MTLPTFFIIGAAKAGTTSLHHYLDQHPEVQMSAVKETNFFAGPPNGIPYPVGRVDRLEDYEALFDPACRVRGEASPSYASAPRRQGVPQRIKELVPGGLFVYVVRDPIDRLVSQYQMLVSAGKERRSLADALARLDDADPHSFYLTCQSFYGRQLELYLQEFPPERILVLDQARLRGEREEALRDVFGFLGVDPGFRSEAFSSELLKGGERRRYPPALQRLKPALRGPVRLLPPGLRGRLQSSFEESFLPTVPKPELAPAERERLCRLFAPDAERLRSLTGLRFESWSV